MTRTDDDLIRHYNYDEFTPEKAFPLLNFEQSPPIGEKGPDFPLWDLAGRETSLSAAWKNHTFTVVEFGSFT